MFCQIDTSLYQHSFAKASHNCVCRFSFAVLWPSFNAFVRSLKHNILCLPHIGEPYPQLDSNFAKRSSHSVTLRLSCLCVSSLARLNIESIQNSNACLLSRYQKTWSIKLFLDKTAAFSSSLSSKSFTNVWSFCKCMGTSFRNRIHKCQFEPLSKFFDRSFITFCFCFVFLCQLNLSFEYIAPRALLSFWHYLNQITLLFRWGRFNSTTDCCRLSHLPLFCSFSDTKCQLFNPVIIRHLYYTFLIILVDLVPLTWSVSFTWWIYLQWRFLPYLCFNQEYSPTITNIPKTGIGALLECR